MAQSPISLDVKGDIKQVTRHLTRVQKKQIPFATSRATQNTAKKIVPVLSKATTRFLDRPTRFTQKAFRAIQNRSDRFRAFVIVFDIQAEYLNLQIRGGIGRPKRKTLIIPGKKLKLDRFGNIGRRKRSALFNRPNAFVGTFNGTTGLWEQNRQGGIDLLLLFKRSARYKKRFPFFKIADKEARRIFPRQFRIDLTKALRTAR